MTKINKIICLIVFLIFPSYLFAQEDITPLIIQQIRKYGDVAQILYDSTDYFYNAKNQLIKTEAYLFHGEDSNDKTISEYEYSEFGNQNLFCANNFKGERLKSGKKRINFFDANQNLIRTIFQENRGGALFNTFQRLYSFDFNNNLSTKTEQQWVYDKVEQTKLWENLSQDSTVADYKGQIIFRTKKYWKENKWQYYGHFRTTYNDNGDILYSVREKCDENNCILTGSELIYQYNEEYQVVFSAIRSVGVGRSGGVFVDSTVTEYIYNKEKNIEFSKQTSLTRLEENPFNYSDYTETYYYDKQHIANSLKKYYYNKQLIRTVEKLLDNSSDKYCFTYHTFEQVEGDTLGRHLKEIEKLRYDTNGSQILHFKLNFGINGISSIIRDTSIYDEHNRLIQKTISNNYYGALTNWYQRIYEFNEFGQLCKEIMQYWENEAWIDEWHTTHQYEDQQLIKTEKYERVKSFYNSDINDFYTIIYYQKPISVALKEVKDFIFSAFPNPLKNQLNIRINNLQFLPLTASIFSVNGQLVFKEKVNTINQTLELPILPNGTYILHLNHKNYQSTKKIIITN